MGAFIVTFPRDRIRTLLFFFIFFRVTYIPAVLAHRFLVSASRSSTSASVANVQTGGVAYLAHIGGFLFGVVTARLIEDPRRIAYRRSFE